ncbi:hypothetical protein DFJ74DRAFT_767104, partial [Hyaloraphidium curvatum]
APFSPRELSHDVTGFDRELAESYAPALPDPRHRWARDRSARGDGAPIGRPGLCLPSRRRDPRGPLRHGPPSGFHARRPPRCLKLRSRRTPGRRRGDGKGRLRALQIRRDEGRGGRARGGERGGRTAAAHLTLVPCH